jgi:hypothetical protein
MATLSKLQKAVSDLVSDRPKNPWNDSPGDDVFFPTLRVNEDNWNKTFPYRLVVIDVTKGNKVVSGLGEGSKATSLFGGPTYFQSGDDYIVSQRSVDTNWVFELPITPQQIQIVDQYAINTTATARGVLEEHNGVKFKMISINATTGILPDRGSTAAELEQPSSIKSVFGGTIQAFENLKESAGRVVSAFTREKRNQSQQLEAGGRLGQSMGKLDKILNPPLLLTGYYKALTLSNFLERYAQEKKNPKNKGWRLVLDILKMDYAYVVTPVSFSLQKSVQSPNEFTFSLQLKAWKRVEIGEFGLSQPTRERLTPSIFQRIANGLRDTRRALSNATTLIKSVRSDFQKPLEMLRQTALAVKDLGGLVFTIADFPGQIIKDYKTSIKESLKITSGSFIRGSKKNKISDISSGQGSYNQQSKSSFIASAIRDENIVNEGLSTDQILAGALGVDAAASIELQSSNDLFENPEEYFEILDSLDIESINLSPDQRSRIEDEISLASLITVDDLNTFKKDMLETALLISNSFGAGDEIHSEVYGRSPPKKRAIPLTVEETEILTALYEMVQIYDILTDTMAFDDLKIQNSLNYIGGIADEAGIDFETSEGKILVPVPFGLTIEQIAARYLGDANKWLEIAAINNLRMPYLDEVGQNYKILSNASGRQLNVNNFENKLYIGQFVTISSNAVRPFRRKILDIERIADNNHLITLDGDDNLDNLKTSEQAQITGFLPGTVNSQNQIFIPSDKPVEEDDLVILPKKFQADKLAKISKVDWLLDDNGDLAINEVGDIQLAGGLTNLIQALKLKLRTKKGTLLQHIDYGLGLSHGISLADIEKGEIIQSLNKMIDDDPRYDGINRLDIRISGSTMFVDLAVNIAQGSGVLPISFQV